jgi:hypothetical protein
VIAINWNWCEFLLDHFIGHYLDLPGPISAVVITPLPNITKTELLAALVNKKETNPNSSELISHFLKCFNINRENRNLIAHSLCVLEHIETEYICFSSEKLQSGDIRERVVPASSAVLSKVCKETKQLFEFGIKISDYWHGARNGSLPKKPPLPGKLTVLHPARQHEMRPPQL